MATLTLIGMLIVAAAVIVLLWGSYMRRSFAYRYSVYILILAVFVALVLIYYPIAAWKYSESYSGASEGWMKAAILIQSIQSAFRTFVLDGEWSDFLSSGMDIPFPVTVAGVFLNVLAPALTFSAILSVFKGIRAAWRIFIMARFYKHMVIMSELNSDSINVAEDIIRTNKRTGIVFTDVFPEDDESSFELKEKATKINAVFLRTDISELNINRSKGLTEYFLVGHDESENVMQAEKLFRKNKDARNTRIFIKAVHKGNALILDSLNSALSIDDRRKDGHEMSYEETKDFIRNGGVLKFRRFDPEKEVAWTAIPAMNFIREAFAAPDPEGEPGEVSILLIADTHLGFTMAKTLLWYCQSDKFKLRLNIVYTDKNDLVSADYEMESWPADIRHLLETECPDIIETNKKETDGDAYYDIEFYEKNEFEQLYLQYLHHNLNGEEQMAKWERIPHTDAVIIDNMRDVIAIETAVRVRTAFKRIESEPEIYAICTDDENILTELNAAERLATHKNEPYDIHFIGKRSDTYTYKNFLNTEAENLGYCQHIKWVDVSGYREGLKDQVISYEKREYFRESSMSKAMYLRNVISDPDKERSEEEVRKALESSGKYSAGSIQKIDENSMFERRLVFRDEYDCENNPSEPSERWTCTCSKCMRRRKLEHNRWNAYMRTLGNIPSPAGNVKANIPIAGIHGNIVSFEELRLHDPGSIEKDS